MDEVVEFVGGEKIIIDDETSHRQIGKFIFGVSGEIISSGGEGGIVVVEEFAGDEVVIAISIEVHLHLIIFEVCAVAHGDGDEVPGADDETGIAEGVTAGAGTNREFDVGVVDIVGGIAGKSDTDAIVEAGDTELGDTFKVGTHDFIKAEEAGKGEAFLSFIKLTAIIADAEVHG